LKHEKKIKMKNIPFSIPTNTLYAGLQGPEVKRINQLLTGLNFQVGGATSIYGPNTKDAITKFQRINNFPITGIADRITIDALQLQFKLNIFQSNIKTKQHGKG